jgi:ParB family chromosome partitioning protein
MVPVIVEPDHLTDVQVIQRQLVANIQRKGLKPLEKAVALDDVMKRATWSAAQAAAHLGLSNAAVTRLLSLLTLPEGIRDKVAAGEISPSVAYELSRIVDSERQTELAEQAAAGKLTREALSAENKRHARPVSEEALAATQSRATAKLALGRSVTVAASSLTLDSFIETLEEVLTRARQARPKGLALATFLKVLRDQSK